MPPHHDPPPPAGLMLLALRPPKYSCFSPISAPACSAAPATSLRRAPILAAQGFWAGAWPACQPTRGRGLSAPPLFLPDSLRAQILGRVDARAERLPRAPKSPSPGPPLPVGLMHCVYFPSASRCAVQLGTGRMADRDVLPSTSNDSLKCGAVEKGKHNVKAFLVPGTVLSILHA